MQSGNTENRHRFKERVNALLPLLVQTARLTYDDEMTAEYALERAVIETYQTLEGDPDETLIRRTIIGRLLDGVSEQVHDGGGALMTGRNDRTGADQLVNLRRLGALKDVKKRLHDDISLTDVHNVVRRLPLPARIVVVLSLVGSFSQREIGDILELPARTVRSRLHEGRSLMRETVCERLLSLNGCRTTSIVDTEMRRPTRNREM